MSPPQERPQGLGQGSGCGQALGLPVWASCLISPSLQAAAEPRTLAALLPPPPPRVLSVQSVPNAHSLRCPQDRATPQPGGRTLWSFRYPVTLGGGGPLPVPCVPEDFVFETCPKVLCPSASQASLGAPICTWRAPRPTSGALRKPLRPCTIYRWAPPPPCPGPWGSLLWEGSAECWDPMHRAARPRHASCRGTHAARNYNVPAAATEAVQSPAGGQEGLRREETRRGDTVGGGVREEGHEIS